MTLDNERPMHLIDIDWRPDRRKLRTFAWIGAAVLLGLAMLALRRHHLVGVALDGTTARPIALALTGTAVLLAVSGSAQPKLLRPLYLGLTLLTFPVGVVASYVLLLVLYYLVFAPLGLALRLFGRDPLERRFQTERATYWVERPRPVEVRRYFKQF